MGDIEAGVEKYERDLAEPSEVGSAIHQEVQEIKKAVNEVVSETSISEKVEELRIIIENISEEVQSWRSMEKDTYVEALETVRSQVDDIQSEWNSVSAHMKAQRERLESLLESFPGVIETSTLHALSLRLTQLEKLVSEIIEGSRTKSILSGARKQFIISIVALGITIILWGVWIGLALIK